MLFNIGAPGKTEESSCFFFFIRSAFLCCLSFRAPVTREGFFKFFFLAEGTLDSRIEIWPLDGIQKGGEKVILIR
jgi:hypothetical protein